MLIVVEFILEILLNLLLDPLFSFHHIVPQVCPRVWHFLQLLPWEGPNKSRGDPDSLSSYHFTLCLLISSAWFFCKASSFIFPCANPAMPISPDSLFLNFCSVCSMASPPYCPSVPSSACFICLILLQSLLLDFPCATSLSPITLDCLFLKVQCVFLQLVEQSLNAAILEPQLSNYLLNKVIFQFKSEQTLFSRTGSWFRSDALQKNLSLFGTWFFVPMSYFI